MLNALAHPSSVPAFPPPSQPPPCSFASSTGDNFTRLPNLPGRPRQGLHRRSSARDLSRGCPRPPSPFPTPTRKRGRAHSLERTVGGGAMGSSAKRPRSAAVPDPALAPSLLKLPSPAAPSVPTPGSRLLPHSPTLSPSSAGSPVAKSHEADNEASFAWPALEDLGLLPAEDEAVLPEREEEGSPSSGTADEVDDARIVAGALC